MARTVGRNYGGTQRTWASRSISFRSWLILRGASGGKSARQRGHCGLRCWRYTMQCTQPLWPQGSVVGPPYVPRPSVLQGGGKGDGGVLPKCPACCLNPAPSVDSTTACKLTTAGTGGGCCACKGVGRCGGRLWHWMWQQQRQAPAPAARLDGACCRLSAPTARQGSQPRGLRGLSAACAAPRRAKTRHQGSSSASLPAHWLPSSAPAHLARLAVL